MRSNLEFFTRIPLMRSHKPKTLFLTVKSISINYCFNMLPSEKALPTSSPITR